MKWKREMEVKILDQTLETNLEEIVATLERIEEVKQVVAKEEQRGV